MEITVNLPRKFKFLFDKARYKAVFGGRGTGKSHSIAVALILLAGQTPLRILCCREIQRSIKDSVKRLIDDLIRDFKLQEFFISTDTEIRGKNGSLFLFAGIKTNPESIKSMEGIDICWIEEASTVSQRSLDFLIPTIRKENSEIWFSWNPENELDPVDQMFRGKEAPPNSIVQRVHVEDNPYFPEVLRQEMEFDARTNPEKHAYIWLGEYNTVHEGAYYSKQISQAIKEGRMGKVEWDKNAPVYVSFDLGISDATALWFAQFIRGEIHILEAIESTGQPITWYLEQMIDRPYSYAPVILPHDARARNLATGKTIEDVIRSNGFQTVICPNIPIRDGIEVVRRGIGKSWFDADKCKEGLRALRAYRENYDEKLKVSRGPLHDWTSHFADSARYLFVGQKEIKPQTEIHLYRKKLSMITDKSSDLEELFKPKQQNLIRPRYGH